MRINPSTLGVSVLALVGVFAILAAWHEKTLSAPRESPGGVTANVTNGSDRGPGSLREALYLADAAATRAKVLIQVKKIALETALPPIVNPRGVSILAQETGAEIDARALKDGPVFDVAAANTSIEGLAVRNCPGAAVLLRAARFRLKSTTIEACQVGVDVAENARDVAIERNRFIKNRVGVRFAATSANSGVLNNEFSASADAGLWAVRGKPDLRSVAISVRDNKFNGDRLGILAGNISVLIEHNHLIDAREAAVHVIGQGVVVRSNRVSGGKAMGIVVENARAAVVESNELDRLGAYAVMVRGSADALIRANRVNKCAYGIAFVLGDAKNPSTAVDNSIMGVHYNGIDVIGDSPILRRNRVLQARVAPLHVEDFQPPGGKVVRAQPFRDGNTFDTNPAQLARDAVEPPASTSSR